MSRHSEARAAHAAQCIEVAQKACTVEERREFLTFPSSPYTARPELRTLPTESKTRFRSRGFQPVKQLFLRA
jgi:hypothetical protein